MDIVADTTVGPSRALLSVTQELIECWKAAGFDVVREEGVYIDMKNDYEAFKRLV